MRNESLSRPACSPLWLLARPCLRSPAGWPLSSTTCAAKFFFVATALPKRYLSRHTFPSRVTSAFHHCPSFIHYSLSTPYPLFFNFSSVLHRHPYKLWPFLLTHNASSPQNSRHTRLSGNGRSHFRAADESSRRCYRTRHAILARLHRPVHQSSMRSSWSLAPRRCR